MVTVFARNNLERAFEGEQALRAAVVGVIIDVRKT
jgi:hypothetical protein